MEAATKGRRTLNSRFREEKNKREGKTKTLRGSLSGIKSKMEKCSGKSVVVKTNRLGDLS